MTQQPPDPQPVDLSSTAAEPTERSLAQEREAVGEQSDAGDLVSPDHAQAAPYA